MMLPDPGGGRVYDLEQPRTEGMPVHRAHKQADYSYLLHLHHGDAYRPEESGPRAGAAGAAICGERTGIHIDALCHQSDDLTLHGGVPVNGAVQTSHGFTGLAVEEVGPILVPGIVLDIAALQSVEALEPDHVITAEDLEGCCEEQGVWAEPESVALVHTGNCHYWDDAERYLAGPGMDAGCRTGSPIGASLSSGWTTWPGTCLDW